MDTYKKLLALRKQRGAGYLVLIDPDKQPLEEVVSFAKYCEDNGADGFLIGGSLLFSNHFDELIHDVKQAVSIPVILFPGNGQQLSPHADAILFLSLISGRNAHYLIGEQVLSAPKIKALNLEPISTGYILVESGKTTAAEFMSHTKPIPAEKPEIAVAHALAAEYLGMKFVYLEAGSGAERSVPEAMVHAVSHAVSIPIIVGGGIRSPEEARGKVKAGASFIVTGNVLEKKKNTHLIKDFAKAIHQG
jgi:phosphoglycerol geranylgeranyltransferase